ncbi:transcription factor bHLH155 [Cornus florida]|uniref:transcription factor bHLH155 n=1 Tax=Cornus florida TaxID=4283 RepID=UPI0028A29965|nr:transcription factor bHLH155 [Cornus florida]
MGTQLHQALRALCFNTDWKYAVFWKLKHGARMMLTWEDAYYDSHEQHDSSDNKCFEKEVRNFHNGRYSHDPLGLAVAKMSYHVHALGEGIVGQVAVTGKHLWIFGDKHVNNFSSSFEYYEGWQTQFSAGIRTVVVVAALPYGVVQLGSLNKITEDLKLVNRIREIFFAFQDSSMGCVPSVIHSNMKTYSCMSDISTRSSFGSSYDCIHNLDKTMSKEKTNICSPMFSSLGKSSNNSYVVPLPGGYSKKTVELINKHGELQLSTPGGCESATLLQSRYEIFLNERQKQLQTKMIIDNECEGKISGFRDIQVGSEGNDTSSSRNYFNDKADLYTPSADNSGVDFMYFPSDLLLDSATWNNRNEVLSLAEPFNLEIQKDSEKNLPEFNDMGKLNKPSNFSAGSELYEALGPAFRKQNTYCDWEVEKTEAEAAIEMPEGMTSSSLLTTDSGSEHLLEAVVASVCCRGSDVKSEKSFCKPVQSLLTTEKMPEPTCDKDTFDSAGNSFDQSLVEDSWQCLNSSDAYGVGSSKGLLSTSHGTCLEQLERPQRLANNKKRGAKSGENCRPRPRDRQLIQDRIKELRELVPNGSKCSIDSLLERTIKHTLFLQSMTTHAEKLNKCAESKLRDKESGIQRLSNNVQGSSWAVEVGSHLKVPIVVENINLNGQMLIEMLCEECSLFLEIADAIKNLGLTILKGVTEAYGKRTWMRFVVEGQNNRSMHRMDILWSLMHILQPKAIG